MIVPKVSKNLIQFRMAIWCLGSHGIQTKVFQISLWSQHPIDFRKAVSCPELSGNLKAKYGTSKHSQRSAPRDVPSEALPEILQLEEMLCEWDAGATACWMDHRYFSSGFCSRRFGLFSNWTHHHFVGMIWFLFSMCLKHIQVIHNIRTLWALSFFMLFHLSWVCYGTNC